MLSSFDERGLSECVVAEYAEGLAVVLRKADEACAVETRGCDLTGFSRSLGIFSIGRAGTTVVCDIEDNAGCGASARK